MNVIRHKDAAEFQHDALDFLLRREAENNLIIGRAGALAREPLPAEILLLALKDGASTIGAAMMTPPNPLVLTDASDDALKCLGVWLRENSLIPPAVVGPKSAVERFLKDWAELTPVTGQLRRSLRVFQLEKVSPPARVPGQLSLATSDDAPLLEEWWDAFGQEIGEAPARQSAREGIAMRLAAQQVYVWRAPRAVSMAAWAGPTPNGVRINLVYTPHEHRNHGYASACVAALSQKLLDEGRRFCFLYTDLANPTSNSIYQKIGYCAVCDWVDHTL